MCKMPSFAGRRMDSAVAPLPEDRVKDASVFEICGIDLAGPLFLRGEEKAWICIFTCAVFRAVHLELIMSVCWSLFAGFEKIYCTKGKTIHHLL